ncbi:DUF914-domain-containing protein [Rhizodiscina lignyota]|uniref:DUF914-domain-containing protein n=1 Tax=Rhizodiscina lignyota TaxID=1504668 RepID=A0A9P4IFD9_9PEZI|nr:DUF914-domain-containing protein [Rhizodiscina lignyota]
MAPSKQGEVEPVILETTHVRPKKSDDDYAASGDGSSGNEQTGPGAPEVVGGDVDAVPEKKWRWLDYLTTKQFWIVLVLGQILALCITATNTFSGLLADEGTSIPAFQTFFNYVLLNAVYSGYTIYRYGFKKWGKLLLTDGWRYFILAFMDVEGNYFVVLAYRYTTILSAQLINFWAIVIVVIVSLIFLHVRYHLAQYLGILICVGGMGLLLASDHITGSNGGPSLDPLKGDLFALLGATFYGLSNCFEEFLVSKRPMYEVVGQLAFWGMLINGTQAGIFDRASFRTATWNGAVAGYIVGYTAMLFIFYSLAPLFFRLTSAAFFNISLLTGNFWGVVIGVQVFHLHIHWMYPIAFVLIILGHFAYYLTESVLGESKKPWLGAEQEGGVSGVGTARRRLENPDVIV